MSDEKDEVIKPEQWTYRRDARRMEPPADPPPEQKKKEEDKKE
ncbi:MAG: hypothetical protein ACXQT2_05660 [Methanotrichaceae archaeon]